MSSGSQDGKVSFRRLCISHLLIFVLQCISHICNSYLHISLLLITSFCFCVPLYLSYCHCVLICTSHFRIFVLVLIPTTFFSALYFCVSHFSIFSFTIYALFIFPYSSLYHFDHINERVLHDVTDEVQLATKMKGKARMPNRERSKLHLCIQPQCQWQGCMDLFWS